jgi:hypothetical protein
VALTEGDREIYIRRGGSGNAKGEGERMKGKERREKENPLRAGEEKGGGIFVEGKKREVKE